MTKMTMLVCLLLHVLITSSFRPAVPSQPAKHAAVSKWSQQNIALANVDLSGPSSLSMCDQGVWSASVSGAAGPFTYEWYLTVPGNGTEPPVTHYVGSSSSFITYLDYWITYPDRSSISLTVDVYNGSGYVGSGWTSVYAYPCF
ncbi:hypothetical protein [Longitalea luteola]|uniref:hypothetical protein n=1 Tax=Longitalea luteola TaxID=2812563 RepID=UPI001A961628|nr:hypothetical protein [Longitalea luteola]